MKTFMITYSARVLRLSEIRAESEEEALKLFDKGVGDDTDLDCLDIEVKKVEEV